MSRVVLGSASPLTADLLRQGLAGHAVEVVDTVSALLDSVRQQRPGVVVLIHTTGRLDALAALTALGEGDAPPVVVCVPDPAARPAFLAAGAAAFLIDSEPRAVADAVRQALSGAAS